MKFQIQQLPRAQFSDFTGAATAEWSDFNDAFDTDDRIIRYDLIVAGGTEFAAAFAIDRSLSAEDLAAAEAAGTEIPVRVIELVDWRPDTPPAELASDTPPTQLRISDVLARTFDEFILRLVDRSIPPGLTFTFGTD